jgi:signal transduction histidine kinase
MRRRYAIEVALHELRRPLQALALGAGTGAPTNGNGYSNDNGPPPLDLAICALTDLDRVVNGVERQPQTRRLLRLRPLVEACLARWMPAAELSGCELGFEWRAGSAAIVADPRRLAQALDNLVANALRHSPAGETVTLRATAAGGRVALEVVDRGPGIPPEERERVFERFYRADRARSSDHGGSGLGLAIARWIVELHGGSIRADREAPLGCRMVVELPQ